MGAALYVPLPSGQAPREHPDLCSPGTHSWAVHRARPPEQVEQGNPFFLEGESQEEAQAGTLDL